MPLSSDPPYAGASGRYQKRRWRSHSLIQKRREDERTASFAKDDEKEEEEEAASIKKKNITKAAVSKFKDSDD